MSVMEGQHSLFRFDRNREYIDAHFSHLLAEDLPVQYAYDRLRKLSTQKSASGWYRSAFAQIEYALCREASLDDDMRSHLLHECGHTLARPMGLQERPTTDSLRLNASLVCCYLPLYKKRALQEEITPEDCNSLYRSTAAALHMSQSLAHDAQSLDSRLAEGIVLALGARTRQPQFIIWPASPREESSSDQPSNHDGYFIDDASDKIGIQTKLLKSGRKYDKPIIVVTVTDLLQHIVKKTAKRFTESISDIDIPDLVDTIFREASGIELTPVEKYQLDIATAHLMRPLSNFLKVST